MRMLANLAIRWAGQYKAAYSLLRAIPFRAIVLQTITIIIDAWRRSSAALRQYTAGRFHCNLVRRWLCLRSVDFRAHCMARLQSVNIKYNYFCCFVCRCHVLLLHWTLERHIELVNTTVDKHSSFSCVVIKQ